MSTAPSQRPETQNGRKPTFVRMSKRILADAKAIETLIDVVRTSPPSCRASRRYALLVAMRRVERLRRRLEALSSIGARSPLDAHWLEVREAELAGLADNRR